MNHLARIMICFGDIFDVLVVEPQLRKINNRKTDLLLTQGQ